jgi:hypothetical protein
MATSTPSFFGLVLHRRSRRRKNVTLKSNKTLAIDYCCAQLLELKPTALTTSRRILDTSLDYTIRDLLLLFPTSSRLYTFAGLVYTLANGVSSFSGLVFLVKQFDTDVDYLTCCLQTISRNNRQKHATQLLQGILRKPTYIFGWLDIWHQVDQIIRTVVKQTTNPVFFLSFDRNEQQIDTQIIHLNVYSLSPPKKSME